jgi:hypothetical protein
MIKYQIEINDHPSSQVAQTIIDGLVHYNTEMAGDSQNTPLSVIVRNENGEIIGGLLGRTYWGWLHINTIWVEKHFRQKGIGEKTHCISRKGSDRSELSLFFLGHI